MLDFDNYRNFLRFYLNSLPNRGRGELSKIAKFLRINTTWLSQILGGTRQFTVDQAIELGEYLQLNEIEIEYFILLVQIERASSYKSKVFLKKKIETLKRESLKLKHQVPFEKSLDEKEKSIFYSSWLFSAIHLFTSTQSEGVFLEDVVNYFELRRHRALEILTFLVQCNLCVKVGNQYATSTHSTFIDKNSPHLLKHHSNWRIKAIEKSEKIDEEELMFTAPVSISESDFKVVRKELVRVIKTISETVKTSESEIVANLNIDWFYIKK